MNAGRLVIVALLLTSAAMAAGLYWTEVYAYYREVETPPGILLWGPDGARATIEPKAFQGIDSDSAPIRYRSCFDIGPLPDDVRADLQPYPEPTPLNAPGWFECFDAPTIDRDIQSGAAVAVLGNPMDGGVDRVLAIYPDGQGFGWNQINPCRMAEFTDEEPPPGCPADPEGE